MLIGTASHANLDRTACNKTGLYNNINFVTCQLPDEPLLS